MDGLWTDRARLHRHCSLVDANQPTNLAPAGEIIMATSILNSSLVLGQVTTERLEAVHVPAALHVSVDAFTAQYSALKNADSKLQHALVPHAHESKLAKSAHAGLRASVKALADAVAHADIRVRLDPLAAFGSSATKVLRKSRAGAAHAAREVAKRVLASSPKKSVRDAANDCIKHAQLLDAAQTKLEPFALALKRAREERDAVLAEFSAAFGHLKASAKYVWRDHPGDFAAVFAPIARSRLDTQRRAAKADQPTTQPNPNPPQPAPATPPINTNPSPNPLLN
jgi:hypothetical protein